MKRSRTVAAALVAGLLACEDTALGPSGAGLALQILAAEGVSLAADAVVIHLGGPTARTVTAQPGQSVTLDGLQPGDYQVAVEGMIAGDVEWFDQFQVSIAAGSTVTRTVVARSFVPANLTVSRGMVEGSEPFRLQWTPVTGAVAYRIEEADNAGFSGPREHDAQGTERDHRLSELDRGTFYIRVRAVNSFGSRSVPSASVTIAVVEPPPLFCPTGDFGFRNIQDAIDAAPVDGAVRICNGTHDVESARVNKPLTLRPDWAANPVLRTRSATQTFLVDGYSRGNVVIDGVTFAFSTPTEDPAVSTSYAVRAQGTYDQLVIRNSTFAIDPAARGAIVVSDSDVPGAALRVENTTISGGQWGIAVVRVHAEITDTEVRGTSERAVNTFGATGLLQSSLFADCGSVQCVRAEAGSDLAMVDNTFEGRHTGEPFEFRAVVFAGGSTVLLTGSHFSGCGPRQCVTSFNGAKVDVVDNRFELIEAERTYHAIIGLDPGTVVDVRDNVILGIDTDANPLTYGIQFAAIASTNQAVVTASGNAITNVQRAFQAFGQSGPHGIIQAATNNRVQHVGTAFWLDGQSSITARFNDIVDAEMHIHLVDDFTTLDLTCNWWGSVAGPQNVDSAVPSSAYTPWADREIAGTGATGCSGGSAASRRQSS